MNGRFTVDASWRKFSLIRSLVSAVKRGGQELNDQILYV
jgi:hypothetical protein